MIKINVAQQLKESVGSVRRYDIDETTEEGFSVRGEVQLLRTNRSILVTGKVKTVHGLTCSRCLEEFDQQLMLDIEEEYALPQNVTGVSPEDTPNEAGAFVVDENNILDLGEAIRQYTLLSLPMKPICRPDCAGLCPSCGHNLNQQTCGCTPPPADSPWSQLQSLRSRK